MRQSVELLFDTNSLIDIYHGRPAIKPYLDAIATGSLAPYVSVLTEAELWRGLRTGELARHNILLGQFTILPLFSEAARQAGTWMQFYQASGLGWMDALIVATAKLASLPVLTRDKRLVTALAAEASFELYGS